MVLVQGNNMNAIKNFTGFILLICVLTNCQNNNDSNKIETDHINPPISGIETQSKKALDDAINALNNVEDEFQWRDTHLILNEAQKAFSDGNFSLSIELAQKVVKQTQLMHEQKEFSDKHWQSLLPKK